MCTRPTLFRWGKLGAPDITQYQCRTGGSKEKSVSQNGALRLVTVHESAASVDTVSLSAARINVTRLAPLLSLGNVSLNYTQTHDSFQQQVWALQSRRARNRRSRSPSTGQTLVRADFHVHPSQHTTCTHTDKVTAECRSTRITFTEARPAAATGSDKMNWFILTTFSSPNEGLGLLNKKACHIRLCYKRRSVTIPCNSRASVASHRALGQVEQLTGKNDK